MACRRFVLVLVPLALCLVVAAGAATAPKTFRDPARDVSGGRGPDVVAVTVSHTAKTVSFGVRFATAPPLRVSAREKWIDMLLIGVDVPPLGPAPTDTGWLGINYVLGVHGTGTVAAFRNMGATGSSRLPATIRGATLTITVPRTKLGSPRWFVFNVAAARETDVESEGSADMAPAKGSFRYVLDG
jgi:hypothetical protein